MVYTPKGVADSLKPVLSNALATQAYAALIAIPGIGWFFALPVVSHLTRAILRRVTDWLVQETAVGLSILWIEIDLMYEVNTAEKAAERLRDMLENTAKYSAAEQAELEKEFDDATVDLIQLSIKRLS